MEVMYSEEGELETASTTTEKGSGPKHPTIKIEKCPVCNGMNLVYQEGCVRCLDCGWASCVIA